MAVPRIGAPLAKSDERNAHGVLRERFLCVHPGQHRGSVHCVECRGSGSEANALLLYEVDTSAAW